MPTYEYRCGDCDHRFERFQKMSDDPVRECERCGGEVQRVLFPVAVHFKGSGFYTTDYARKKTLCSSSNGGASCTDGSCEKAQAASGSGGSGSAGTSTGSSGSSSSGSGD